jgi:hypothetical protein
MAIKGQMVLEKIFKNVKETKRKPYLEAFSKNHFPELLHPETIPSPFVSVRLFRGFWWCLFLLSLLFCFWEEPPAQGTL